MFNEYDDMLNFEELCEMLRIGKNKCYKLLNSGAIEGFRNGRVWLIPKQAVLDFISNARKARKI